MRGGREGELEIRFCCEEGGPPSSLINACISADQDEKANSYEIRKLTGSCRSRSSEKLTLQQGRMEKGEDDSKLNEELRRRSWTNMVEATRVGA